ncbi:MAG: phage holin family protein [Chitinophagales bacterium]|nr:phage holin family protein [Chitinophagales bacterium]MCZ2394711.1 phage holin family protein [Chitinophagales bacterium]
MNWIIKILFRVVTIYLISYLTNIITFSGNSTKENFIIATIFAVMLSLLNTFLRPILSLFALPITFITLGLFQLVINTVIVLITVRLVKGIEIEGFWNAFLFSILFSVISWAIEQVVSDK